MASQMLDCPIFVIGCLRSGKSLTAAILNKHPEIHIMFEQQIFNGHYRRWVYECSKNKNKPSKIFLDLLDTSFFGDCMQEIKNALTHLIEKNETSWAVMFKKYIAVRMQITKPEAKYWGDKTPSQAGLLSSIHDLFPKSRMIYLYRDPRNTAAEMSRNDYSPTSGKLLMNAYLVHQMLSAYENEIQDDKLNLLKIRYESLVESPIKQVKKICNFLKIDYMSSLLVDADPSLKKSIGWEDDSCWMSVRNMPVSDKATDPLLEAYLKPWIIRFGYAPKDIKNRIFLRILSLVLIAPFVVYRNVLNFLYSMKYAGHQYFLYK